MTLKKMADAKRRNTSACRQNIKGIRLKTKPTRYCDTRMNVATGSSKPTQTLEKAACVFKGALASLG
tara:strand:+ start:351 stop:551 length:201 start_codon:yes stop_codon:yes gene_type:complete